MILLTAIIIVFASQAKGLRENCHNLTSGGCYMLELDTCRDQCVDCFGRDDECCTCTELEKGVSMNGNEICQGDALLSQEMVTSYSVQFYNCSESESNSVSRLVIIYAAAGGGGGLTLCFLLLCCCCCCCCCYARRRKNKKSFDVRQDPEHESIVMSVVKEQLPPVTSKETKDDKLSVQLNLALSESSIAPLTNTNNCEPPNSCSVGKSHSSYEITNNNSNSLNPRPNSNPTMEDKGYVEMASAGSVQFSRSLQNLTTDDETDIYVEPDQTLAALLLPTHPPPTTTAPAHKHFKPATLPKPVTLTTHTASSQDHFTGRHSPSPSPGPNQTEAAETGSQEKDHYNKNAFLLPPRLGDSPQTIYANVDDSKDSSKEPPRTDPDPQTIYANADELDGSCSDKDSSKDEDNTLPYENLKDFLNDKGEENGADSSHYYSTPDTGNTGVCRPEEDAYVYIKSATKDVKDNPSPVPYAGSKDRKRLESEPLRESKKYVNFSREQQCSTQAPAQGVSKENNANSNAKKENGVGSSVSAEEAPLYANYTEDHSEEEEEELYSEVT